MTRTTTVALCLAMLAPLPVQATEVNVMPSFQYDEIGAKLMMRGYRDLRVVDAEGGIIEAYDSDGSEVLIKVNEQTRQLLSIIYVRDADS